MVAAPGHVPVLMDELLSGLSIKQRGVYVDCTIGGGGHAERVLGLSAPGSYLYGIDLDDQAIKRVQRRLAGLGDSFTLINNNFANLAAISKQYNFSEVDGIYLDLGFSAFQIEEPGRGFSFRQDDPLDMRFDQKGDRTASDLINGSTVEQIAEVLRGFGEEPRGRTIARRIVANRPLHSTAELARVVQRAAPESNRRIHPATRTFQAIRMWVNGEIANLQRALPQALNLLKPGGRIGVISFHSIEDRTVKGFFAQEGKDCLCPPAIPVCVCGHIASLNTITKKVVTPSPEELGRNPRSRSAKLRIAQKL